MPDYWDTQAGMQQEAYDNYKREEEMEERERNETTI